jgi:TetR/AcrR family transcriptional regulator
MVTSLPPVSSMPARDSLRGSRRREIRKLIPEDHHRKICRERRDREKARRIASILEAAKKVFAARGYLKATMDEIALTAEITKPTIYLYFKTKDDLFFTLMLPLIEDVHRQLQKVEKNLQAGKLSDGAGLIGAIFRGFYSAYEKRTETFRIIQLFQQQGLVGELRPEVRSALNDRGRANFILHRRLLGEGMEKGLLRKADIHELADVIWATFVGVIQLEDAKSTDRKKNRHLTANTLRLAEELIAGAMTIQNKDKGKKK